MTTGGRRLALSVAALWLAAAAGTLAAGAPPPDPLSAAEAWLASGPHEGIDATRLQHQLRNHAAIAELVAGLPAARRPSHIVYLASGGHLAALSACIGVPAGQPCTLVFTEIDPTAQAEISGGLAALAAAGVVGDVDAGPALTGAAGARTWRLHLAGRPVTLTLDVAAAADDPPVVRPELLEGADLVISHDWSGDPLGNLQVVHWLLAAVRTAKLARAPLLMIEDLEAHPYPVDLALFTLLARTREPYGHRASEAGLGRHGDAELGTPLFGGGVVLGFDDPWWREVDDATLTGTLDLLLLSAFDDQRQNVLSGGPEPVLAPAALDWWTGFGSRTLGAPDLRETPLARRAAVEAALRALPHVAADLRPHLACRLRLYRCLLEARAAGFDVRSLLPASSIQRHLAAGELPSDEMQQLYRDALRHIGEMRTEREAVVAATEPVLATLRAAGTTAATASCPCELPADGDGDGGGEAWAAAYRAHRRWLSEHRGR